MNKYFIEQYDTFNTKLCPDELIFGNFIEQPITPEYYNSLNYDNEDVNNAPDTPVDYALPENEGVQDALMPNDEEINGEIIIIDDDDILASAIYPPPKLNPGNLRAGQKKKGREIKIVDE